MPASVEISFWVAILVFPLLQVIFSVFMVFNADTAIDFVSGPIRLLYLIIYLPLVFSMTHAIVFLLSGKPDNWSVALATVSIVVVVIVVVALYYLQCRLLDAALIRGAED